MTDKYGNDYSEIIQARAKYVIILTCGCQRHKPHGIHRSTIRKMNGKCKIKHKHLSKTQWQGIK